MSPVNGRRAVFGALAVFWIGVGYACSAKAVEHYPPVKCGDHSFTVENDGKSIVLDGLEYISDATSGIVTDEAISHEYVYNNSRATVTIDRHTKQIWLVLDNEDSESECKK